MKKMTFLVALFAVLNFSLALAGPAHAHPGCQSACAIVLAEDGEDEGGECDKDCDKDCDEKDCDGEEK